MSQKTVEQLHARINAMTPQDRLLVASHLIDSGKFEMAESLLFHVIGTLMELQRKPKHDATGDRP